MATIFLRDQGWFPRQCWLLRQVHFVVTIDWRGCEQYHAPYMLAQASERLRIVRLGCYVIGLNRYVGDRVHSSLSFLRATSSSQYRQFTCTVLLSLLSSRDRWCHQEELKFHVRPLFFFYHASVIECLQVCRTLYFWLMYIDVRPEVLPELQDDSGNNAINSN